MALIQFSGLASGIDSKSLIDALVEARLTTNELRRDEIDLLESTNDALDELNTKILKLSDLVDQFRTINGGGVRKKATSSDSTVVTAVAGSNAVNSSFQISTVTSVADTATASLYKSGGTDFSALTDLFEPVGGEVMSIIVGSDTFTFFSLGTETVQDFIDQFNASSDMEGKAVASAINVAASGATPKYRVLIQSLNQGTSEGGIAIADGLSDVDNTIDNATDLVFAMSGITGNITRSNNAVNDIISGVTMNFLKSSGTAVTITISNDADATANQAKEIVTAFNDIVEYINENDTISRVEDGQNASNVYGSLAKTRVDNDFITLFREQLISAESANGTVVTSIAEMGISTNRDGTLTLDIDALKEAIGQDATGVGEVLTDFADAVGGTTGTLYQFTKYNGFIDLAVNSNNSQIQTINDAIDALERSTDKMRERLEGQFTRLESVTAQLQSQQQALTGILGGL